jgi:hypothetical protein
MSTIRSIWLGLLVSFIAITAVTMPATAQQQQKPNIVVIWGDDIGQSDVSAYSHGLMGFKTPNIDRLAKEGMMFTVAGSDEQYILWRRPGERWPGRNAISQPSGHSPVHAFR